MEPFEMTYLGLSINLNASDKPCQPLATYLDAKMLLP